MRSLAGLLLACGLAVGVGGAEGRALARSAAAGDVIQVQDMQLTVPAGWSLRQDAKDDGTIILGFERGAEYLTLYVKGVTGLDMRAIFNNGSTVVRDVRQMPRNSYNWKVLETSKSTTGRTAYVASFLTEHNGASYYGYARGASSQAAIDAATAFLTELR